MNYLKNQIYYTFIHEHRYRLFVEGIYITLLLTLASFLLGTVFGILLCAARRSRRKTVSSTASKITSVLVQIPTMVMLMIMVYLIFGESSVPVLILVIIGLTLKTGAYISEIINTALNAVDPGELEAARTLGMSQVQTFRHIILPQVINTGISGAAVRGRICVPQLVQNLAFSSSSFPQFVQNIFFPSFFIIFLL